MAKGKVLSFLISILNSISILCNSSANSNFANELEAIMNGTHNDKQCRKYGRVQASSKNVTQMCKFKNYPEEITKLLEKIVIETDGTVLKIHSATTPLKLLDDPIVEIVHKEEEEEDYLETRKT